MCVNSMDKIDKIGSIGAKTRVDEIRLEKNLKIIKYIFTIIAMCIDLSWFIFPKKFLYFLSNEP